MDDIFDFEKLKKDQEMVDNLKAASSVAGSITSGFSDIPSSHELLYGGKPRRSDLSANLKRVADGLQDPSERQAKLFQGYKAQKEAEEFKKKDAEDAIIRDPNSQRSKALKAFAKQRGLQIDDNASAYDVMQMMDPKKITESEADFERQKKLRQMDNDFNAKQKSLDRQNDIAIKNMEFQKKNAPKSFQEKLAGLGAQDKARYDNAVMVAKEINNMAKALESGDNTFSMWGDNNYTAAERKAAEAYGRMQSGGAINKEEEERFLAMLPRGKDSAQMQRRKLVDQYQEMASRLQTLGFSPEEAGLSLEDFTYGLEGPEKDEMVARIESKKNQPSVSEEQAKLNKQQALLEIARRDRERKTKEARR